MLLRNTDTTIQNMNLFPCVPKARTLSVRNLVHTVNTEHILCYILEGSFGLHIMGQDYIARQNQMVLFPKDMRRFRWFSPQKFPKVLEFRFLAEVNGEDFVSFFNLSSENLVVSLPPDPILNSYDAMLTDHAWKHDITGRIMLHTELSRLIGLYMEARLRLENILAEFSDILSFMENHLTEDLSLYNLADKIHLNPNYFVTKFKAHFGISPMQHFAQLRVLEAIRLLRTTDMPIAGIGKAVGIQDFYRFRNFFSKHTGLRPEEFRKIITSMDL